MLHLPNNTRCGATSVYPDNYLSDAKEDKAELLSKKWRITFIFYDDNLKLSKKIILKRGLSDGTLKQRRGFV